MAIKLKKQMSWCTTYRDSKTIQETGNIHIRQEACWLLPRWWKVFSDWSSPCMHKPYRLRTWFCRACCRTTAFGFIHSSTAAVALNFTQGYCNWYESIMCKTALRHTRLFLQSWNTCILPQMHIKSPNTCAWCCVCNSINIYAKF